MFLYLVRHGDAKTRLEDPERGLSDKGKRDAEEMAAFLGKHDLHVYGIWHSGKKRAEQTAEILASAISSETGVSFHGHLEPNAFLAPVQGEIERLQQDLMIVGHLPFVGKLMAALLRGQENPNLAVFEPATVVCLERDIEGYWRLCWMIVPSLISAK